MTLRIMTLGIMISRIMTLGIMTLRIKTLGIMTLGIMTLRINLLGIMILRKMALRKLTERAVIAQQFFYTFFFPTVNNFLCKLKQKEKMR